MAHALKTSKHASIRQQQRSIPNDAVELLLDFAEVRAAPGGADKYFFTKRSWRQAAAYLGPEAKRFERFSRAFAIVSNDGILVTIGWKH